MKNAPSHKNSRPTKDRRIRILAALLLCMFLYGAYFYDLLRGQLHDMLQKQTVLESLKILAVPGKLFLKHIGTADVFGASLFYLALIGILLVVFLVLSLLFRGRLLRGVFLFLGLSLLIGLLHQDRNALSFSLVLVVSFASFYLLTLPCAISFSIREILLLFLIAGLITGSLMIGSGQKFFLKVRDRVLFDTPWGNSIVSFYYTHSPLAASLLTPEASIYMGIVFDERTKDEKPLYMGHGIFLSGNPGVKNNADFNLFAHGNGLTLQNRYGNRLALTSLASEELKKAVIGLFSLKGLLKLNTIALYFLPAGCLILGLMCLKIFIKTPKAFSLWSIGLGLAMLVFIWSIHLTGNSPPDEKEINSVSPIRDGLSIAYYLDSRKKIPAAYFPVVKKMAQSESIALRYWGAIFLGRLGDVREAKTLMALMEDPCPNVRYMAALSLYRLVREGSFKPLLIRLVTDPSWYVRCKIYSVFLKVGMIPSPV